MPSVVVAGRLICRAAWLVLIASPSLAALAALALSGKLAPVPAGIGGTVILFLTALFVARLLLPQRILGRAVQLLADEDAAEGAAPGFSDGFESAGATELTGEILRLARTRRRQLGAVRAQLAAAEAIVAALPDPLIVLDERRRILRINKAAEEEFVGALAEPRDLATALRNPAVLAAADAVLRGEAGRVVDFAVAVPHERQLRAYLSRIAPTAPGGAAATLTLHDVSTLKRAEQMRADFIANASHELRTPLAALSGFIETLRGPAREDAEARERFLAIMQQQAGRMTRLVEDLLSLSRVERNEHVPPQGRVALAPLLHELADALELHAAERRMHIALRLPPDLPDVIGERDEVVQLFQNLLDNAIKYGRAGSAITIGAEAVLRPAFEGGAVPFVAVAVKDEGEGIAREHLPRLTERFYRADTARSRAMGGTGLGLAIVKHILNRHRGLLEIDSTLDVGSVFTVLLRPHPAGSPAPAAEQRARTGPLA
jgi:two-component system phosphate regulon sensor histidine kinase PhoR